MKIKPETRTIGRTPDAGHRTRIVTADATTIAEAAVVLRAGGTVAFPTETVYGLGADATSGAAVARIYAAKRRPAFNPLIAHVESLAAAQRHGVFSGAALALAEALWPGPLTLVVPLAATGEVCDLARAGLDSVGLRVPAHPTALHLIAAAGRPLAAPSANRSGRISPVTAADVAAELGGAIDLILDDGACIVGVESTIVACLDDRPRLLRPGGVARSTLEAIVGQPLAEPPAQGVVAPGMLPSHYAPHTHVRLNATRLEVGEAGLDFGGSFGTRADALDLSPSRDLREAAANLFGYLRALDARRVGRIAVAPVPDIDLGEAINDRLRRAAAPRPQID